MANIQPEIDDFASAVYGEEVRGSMISLAEKLNREVEAGTTTINQYTTDITQAIADATSAASAANDAADDANDAADAANAARTAVEANETARQAAETARQSAESGRASAEAGRVAAEQGRVTAEQGRAAAEASRASAEGDRANAEAQRAVAEGARAGAEATRVAAEAERVGREAARVANEDLRVAQERDRVNAETERQRAFNNMSQQVLPPATTTTLGGVIVGDGLSADADGKISVVGGGDIETRTHAEATYAKITDLDGKANATHVHAASDITSGTLPVSRGGTGLDASPSMLTNLGSTTAANVMQASPRPGVTGTLPIANGGTGVTANPSMLTNLESTVADTVFEATPRPGVTGTLPVANGGTGKATHTANALLTGDGTNAVKNVSTADGALYATAANGAAQFGTLPIAQGGTAGTTKAEARTSLEVPANSSIAPVESVTATANHAIGDYFMLGDTLMVATTTIATGETINTSNATSATVQAQIDAIRDSLSWTLVRAGDLSDTVSANGSKELRIPFTVPDGYYPVAILNHSAGTGFCYTASYTISGSDAVLYVHNVASSVANVTAWAYVLCFKRAMS